MRTLTWAAGLDSDSLEVVRLVEDWLWWELRGRLAWEAFVPWLAVVVEGTDVLNLVGSRLVIGYFVAGYYCVFAWATEKREDTVMAARRAFD